jgi:hypothetical protein
MVQWISKLSAVAKIVVHCKLFNDAGNALYLGYIAYDGMMLYELERF